jgi:hypothetical protein
MEFHVGDVVDFSGCHIEACNVHLPLSSLFFSFFETGSHYVAKTGLKLTILLP